MDLEKPRPDDHEAKMARADCYKLAEYSAKLFQMIKEGEELDGWVQAKITKAADYISSVYHYLEYEKMSRESINLAFNDRNRPLKESLNANVRS